MRNFIGLVYVVVLVLAVVAWLPGGAEAAPGPRPDSDSVAPPPPGFSYGGIPYGSMSGNVAEFYRQRELQQRAAPSVLRRADYLQSSHLFTL